MGLHSEVDFRTVSDTGEPEGDAIIPYTDGESVNQTVLRRPTENTRSRTDLLRDLVRELVVLSDMDRHGVGLTGGGTVTFNGAKATYSGQFTVGADIVMLPFATPGGGASAPYVQSVKAALSVGTPSTNELVFTSKYRQWEDTGSDPDIAKEANKISVEMRHTGALSVALEGAAGEENNIVIDINSGTTTCQQVLDALTADADIPKLITFALGGGTLGSAAAPTFTEADWGTDYTARFLRGGAAGIAHIITNTNLNTFWTANAENSLEKGDTLAIWYDALVALATDGGRFQSTPENTNITIPATALFNTRREPAKIPHCIPICKCLDDDTLLFSNNTHVQRTKPSSIQSYPAEYGPLGTPLGWSRLHNGPAHNPPTTIREALDNTDGRLNINMSEVETARTSSSTGAHASLNIRLEAAEAAAGGPFVTVGPTGSGSTYEGVTGFQTALDALKNIGGVIYLHKAEEPYPLTASVSITRPLQIIGVGYRDSPSDYHRIQVTMSTYVLTFSADASGSRIEGLLLDSAGATAGQLDFTGSDCTLRDCTIECQVKTSTGSDRLLVERCQFSNDNNLCFTTVTGDHIFRQCTFTVTGTTGNKLIFAPFKSRVESCVFTLSGGAYIGSSGLMTYTDITINADLDAGTNAVFSSGINSVVNGVRITKTDTTEMVQPAVNVGSGAIVKDVVIDLQDTECRASYIIEVDGGFDAYTALENFTIKAFEIPYDVNARSVNNPFIKTYGTSVTHKIVVKHGLVTDMTTNVSATGSMTGAVVGNIGGSDCDVLFDDITVHTSGLTYASCNLDIFYMQSGAPLRVTRCAVRGTGILNSAFTIFGGLDLWEVTDNYFEAFGSQVDRAVWVWITGAGHYGGKFNGNTIRHDNLLFADVCQISGQTGGAVQNVRIENNLIMSNTTSQPTNEGLRVLDIEDLICWGNVVGPYSGTAGIVYGGNVNNPLPTSGSLGTYNKISII